MSKPNTRGAASDKQNSDDSTENLINKVCAKFTIQLEAKFDTKFQNLNDKLDGVINMFSTLNKEVKTNQKDITDLQNKCKLYEMYFKRNSLIFHGIPEDGSGSVLDAVLPIINNALKVPCVSSDVDSVYRLRGQVDHQGKQGQQSIRINFTSNNKRNDIFGAKKMLKNSGITVYEDLTRDQYELYKSAKKKYGYRMVWTVGGRIYVNEVNI
ncbi:hypothetical protein NQ315_010851 [Exocentrus adspersus]|uniref:Uncharacterized protein n=1 Tax=Exocentrus adspersus TaxID=1586481 RepID=A0AAV8VBV3_9CUCU|nr:hypothetical protein NQ315_010851 [Exocentrus adspersus]